MKNKKPLVILFLLSLTFITLVVSQNQNNNTDNNSNQSQSNNSSDNSNSTAPQTNNSTSNSNSTQPIITYKRNETDILLNDNFHINIYKSTDNVSLLGLSYIKYINLKEELYVTPFKEFNNKFSPENKNYTDKIYNLGSYWFTIAVITGILFVVYLILNKCFGKFRGSKKENLEDDFKYYAWGVFSKLL